MTSEAPACRAALNQANVRWPGRAKKSDGILSSTAHQRQNPSSDHDFGEAVDVTHDPSDGPNCANEAERLADLASRGRAPWIKYLIFNRRIWSAARAKEGWRPYNGSNPHDKHLHISINRAYRDADIDWWDPPTPARPVNREDDDMTPKQARQLEEVHQMLEALVRPRRQDKADHDRNAIDLGDVLTRIEEDK